MNLKICLLHKILKQTENTFCAVSVVMSQNTLPLISKPQGICLLSGYHCLSV